ncbi:DNA binding domain, excisionase family [Mycolicibacterium mageritense DSM 44476 = CIP 104973]|nr:DNA binding domain, excisionase family [Mycolicibacterium mageritense DSM 44476 = CIP 104973]
MQGEVKTVAGLDSSVPDRKLARVTTSDPIAAAVAALVAAIADAVRVELQATASPARRRHAPASDPDVGGRPYHRDQDAPGRILTPDSILTIPETAAELRICRSYVYKLMNQGKIRTLKLGNRTLIQHREVLRFIAELEAGP